MSTAKKIKVMLVEREMTMGRLATLLDIKPPTLSIKIKRDNFSESDLKKIADVLQGCKTQAIVSVSVYK